jgi:hypothetical protein
MNHIRLRPAIFAGFLFLVFPLIGFEAPCANAKNDPRPPVTDSRRGRIAPGDLLRFLDTNAGRLKPAEVDKGILRLLTLQKEYLKSYESQLFSDAVNPKLNSYNLQDLIRLRKIKEGNIKELVRNILADGFTLSSSEGMVYPEIDYPGISAHFGRYASKPVAGYLRIMARETAQHFAEDAALKISLDALGRRIVAIETYLKENPRFVRRNEVRELGQRYLTAYLIGLNNTPAFSYQTNRLNNRFYQSYQNTITKFPGSKFAGAVKEYLILLVENNFQKTRPVLNFATYTATNL